MIEIKTKSLLTQICAICYRGRTTYIRSYLTWLAMITTTTTKSWSHQASQSEALDCVCSVPLEPGVCVCVCESV